MLYMWVTSSGCLTPHEPIGVLIYDAHYRREIERYNGPFFPEPPNWSTMSIHLLTNHVKHFTSCPTCKTSEHPAALCPIRARYYVPDSPDSFSNRGSRRKFSKTSDRTRPQRTQATSTTTSSSISPNPKIGTCAYFNRKEDALKGKLTHVTNVEIPPVTTVLLLVNHNSSSSSSSSSMIDLFKSLPTHSSCPLPLISPVQIRIRNDPLFISSFPTSLESSLCSSLSDEWS